MKRIQSYDLLRVICFTLIIYYHMVVQLGIDGIYEIGQLSRWYETANLHFATTPVAVFFLLSGASLGLTAGASFSVKKYYKKRMVRLLVPYYLCTIVCMPLVLVTGIHFPGFEPASTPVWRILFNFLGMDTWVSGFGISTFSLGLGEWFLGELMILSILFPLFRSMIRKYPKAFLGFCFLIYAGTLVLYEMEFFPGVPAHTNLILKGFEFILGIYLGMYREQIPKKCSLPAIGVFLLLALWPYTIPISAGLKITVLAVGFFLGIFGLESFLDNYQMKAVKLLGSCSYELFLCHHMVIYLVSKILESHIQGPLSLILFFAAEILGMVIVTPMLKWISDRIVNLLLYRGAQRTGA